MATPSLLAQIISSKMHCRLPLQWVDETTVNELEAEKNTCYMWEYGCGMASSAGPKLVLFDYQDGRGGKHPKAYLCGYNWYLHVDGYAGHQSYQDVICLGE